jgi:hypothetical protein
MGKQAKPKPQSQKGTQRKHNPLTRGINTKKPDLLWDWSLLYDAVEERLPGDQSRTVLIHKDVNDLRVRLHPPFDDLLIDWETEIQHFAVESGAKLERTPLPTGGSRYSVYNEVHIPGRGFVKKELLVIETPRKFVSFGPKSNKRKKEKKHKEQEAAPTPPT